jgi:hypothetical protein
MMSKREGVAFSVKGISSSLGSLSRLGSEPG